MIAQHRMVALDDYILQLGVLPLLIFENRL
jgi:hypothetical protein